ncbi:uncharacterized protein FIBRA_02319 [Fibroporia radiculosa]|uniref:Uncharacterized protein n=1 Tax=Fibroporia radiculosa TaxID=599839 RepID=J4H1S6_9APHY|nr:uncharacterized protein FIBRA_02319 [Fibroporia radiculosa]CCM00289.1 predicted protein [Fibroporia radiculosa]
MTRALGSSDKTGRRDSQKSVRGVAASLSSRGTTPLPLDSPPALAQSHLPLSLPEPPDTPPPLAPALVSALVHGSGLAHPALSSRSSPSSTSETAYDHTRSHHSSHSLVPANADPSRSPEQCYSSSQSSSYTSPITEDNQSQSNWAYGAPSDLQYTGALHRTESLSSASSHASTPPSPTESGSSHHEGPSREYTDDTYPYGPQYDLAYPDQTPNPRDLHYADHPVTMVQHSPSIPASYHAAGSVPVSRHSIAHISPPQHAALISPAGSSFSHTSVEPQAVSPTLPRYAGDVHVSSASAHASPVVDSYPTLEDTSHRMNGVNTAMSAHYPEHSVQAHLQSDVGVHRSGRSMAGSGHAHTPPSQQLRDAYGQPIGMHGRPHNYGTAARSLSPPLHLPPLHNERQVRDDLGPDARQPDHAHVDVGGNAASFIRSPLYPQHQMMSSSLQPAQTQLMASPSAGSDQYVPLHQPRPQYAGHSYHTLYPPSSHPHPHMTWRVEGAARNEYAH